MNLSIGSTVVYAPHENAKYPRFIGRKGVITRRLKARQELFIEVDSRIVLLVPENDIRPVGSAIHGHIPQ